MTGRARINVFQKVEALRKVVRPCTWLDRKFVEPVRGSLHKLDGALQYVVWSASLRKANRAIYVRRTSHIRDGTRVLEQIKAVVEDGEGEELVLDKLKCATA